MLNVADAMTISEIEAAYARAVEIGKLLASIEGGEISHGGGGSDIGPLLAFMRS